MEGAPATGFVSIPATGNTGMHSTCNACGVTLSSPEDQRQHYKTEWHRHNLKRRVANLPKISEEEFNTRIAALSAQAPPMPQSFECAPCRKSFHSQRAFEQHQISHKHRERVAAQSSNSNSNANANANENENSKNNDGEDLVLLPGAGAVNEEDMQAELERRLEECKKRPNTTCLFCNVSHPTLKRNLEHMAVAHGLFIADAECVTDLSGMIDYLKEKICVGFVCLWCNGKGKTFHSLEAVQGHMLDKSHCRIAYEDEDDWDEFADFYDYKERNKAQGLRESDSEDDDNDNDDDDNDSGGWEEVAQKDWDENDKQLVTAVASHKIGMKPLGDDDSFQAVLPSGKRLGHREFRQYYKQKLRPQDTRKPVMLSLLESYKHMEVANLMNHSELTPQEVRRQKIAQRAETAELRRQSKWQQRLGVQNNNVARQRYVNATLQWS